MTTETTETPVITELPPAKRTLRDRLPKRKTAENADTEASETPTKGRKLHGVYVAGTLLLGAGVVAALASKARKKETDEVTDVPTDTENPDN